jgi:predicted protein tyrosine phosphatase
MRLIVTDRESIEQGIHVGVPFALISIRDPSSPRPRIQSIPKPLGVLHLAFDDAEPAANLQLPPEIHLMTAKQAKSVWSFVRDHQPQIGAVVVHCEQGMSRSPAVAAALAKAFGEDETRFFRDYAPNEFVYRLLLENQGK